MVISVKDLIGDNAITLEDGQTVYETIDKFLKTGDSFALDFTGVSIFSSPFFNAAIGQLYKDYNSEQLTTQLTIKGLSTVGTMTIQRVIENAQRYYQSSDYRDAVKAAVSESIEEED